MLAERLGKRREEIEHAIATRVLALAPPGDSADPAYLQGLHASLKVAIEYGLEAIERGEEHAPPVPGSLMVQARMAARNQVNLEIVLRRYFVGYGLLAEFAIEEAETSGLLEEASLRDLLRGQSAVFDRLIAAVSEEHRREKQSRPGSNAQRRLERVKRLLAGELLDSNLDYPFEALHLGVVARGEAAPKIVRRLSTALNCRLLHVCPGNLTVWAWLGTTSAIDVALVRRHAGLALGAGTTLAIGEPARSLSGWRLTHLQAKAALPIALQKRAQFVRYSDCALLASAIQDDLLTASFRELYLRPLKADRDEGRAARQALRAYFDAERNVSSAAASLGVSRRTVANRLNAIEKRIGRPLGDVTADLDIALRLEELASTEHQVAA